MSEPLQVWALFKSPADAPGQFVLRRFELHDGHAHATLDAHYSLHADKLRKLMRDKGLRCIGRSDEDEPQVVETWL
jgi:hypothetical protein